MAAAIHRLTAVDAGPELVVDHHRPGRHHAAGSRPSPRRVAGHRVDWVASNLFEVERSLSDAHPAAGNGDGRHRQRR